MKHQPQCSMTERLLLLNSRDRIDANCKAVSYTRQYVSKQTRGSDKQGSEQHGRLSNRKQISPEQHFDKRISSAIYTTAYANRSTTVAVD